MRRESSGRIAVFAPAPVLTITVEPGGDRPEVHLHAGGQGLWVARLAATLGAEVVLCCALGGEPGRVLRGLIEAPEAVTLRAVQAATPSGVYIHDRRGGSRSEIVNVESRPLGRHAADELYGVALGAGLDADLSLITGSQPADILPADLYRRLVSDLRQNGRRVIADLTGPPLGATLRGASICCGSARTRRLRRATRRAPRQPRWSRPRVGCMRPAPATCCSPAPQSRRS